MGNSAMARKAGAGKRLLVRVGALILFLVLAVKYGTYSSPASSHPASGPHFGSAFVGPNEGRSAGSASEAGGGETRGRSFALPSVIDAARAQNDVNAEARHHGERMDASGECRQFKGPQQVDYHDMDVVIVMVAPVCTTRQIVQRLNYHYNFRRIYFIVKSKEYCPFLKSLDDSIICLDENTVIPGVTYSSLAAAGAGLKQAGMKQGTNRVGWYLQQYLKLGVAVHIPDLSDYYLVWDADNIPTRPISFFAEATGAPGAFKKSSGGRRIVRFCGNPVSYKSTGYARFYKRTTGEMLMKPTGYPKDPKGDSFNYVCGYMVMYRPHVQEMLEHFTQYVTRNEPELFTLGRKAADITFPWDIHAVANPAALEGYWFSEYDSYGSWVQSRYPDEHEVDLDVKYARNPGVYMLPGGMNVKDAIKLPAIKKAGTAVTYPCCLTHKRICSISGAAAENGESTDMIHILVWEEHKMRYRSNGQCTDKLPPDLNSVVEQVGHGVKAVGPGS